MPHLSPLPWAAGLVIIWLTIIISQTNPFFLDSLEDDETYYELKNINWNW